MKLPAAQLPRGGEGHQASREALQSCLLPTLSLAPTSRSQPTLQPQSHLAEDSEVCPHLLSAGEKMETPSATKEGEEEGRLRVFGHGCCSAHHTMGHAHWQPICALS